MNLAITFRISLKQTEDPEKDVYSILKKFYWVGGLYNAAWKEFEGNITVHPVDKKRTEKIVYLETSEEWAIKLYEYLNKLNDILKFEFLLSEKNIKFFLSVLHLQQKLPKNYSVGDYIPLKNK